MSLPTIQAAARYFNAPDITGPSRLPHNLAARYAVILVMRDRDGGSYPQIGRRLNRDHSTIIHSYARAKYMLATNRPFALFVEAQMDLPKHSPEAADLPFDYEAPTTKRAYTRPPRRTPPPRIRQIQPPAPEPKWEVIPMTGAHPLVLDEEGYTPEDRRHARNMVLAARRYTAALLREQAA